MLHDSVNLQLLRTCPFLVHLHQIQMLLEFKLKTGWYSQALGLQGLRLKNNKHYKSML